MKINIIKLYKPAYKEYETIIQEYYKRLSSFIKIENTIIHNKSDKRVIQQLLNILTLNKNKPNNNDVIICLDEKGQELSTLGLSKKLNKFLNNSSIKTVHIIVGGPYGINENIKAIASQMWSLSKMTLTSDIAWLLIWEQLYRALTIIKNIPYHH